MKSVSGRYINPFGTGRRRASSAASYLQLPNHEPRPQVNGNAATNGGAVTPPPPYSPPFRRKRAHPLAHSHISVHVPPWSSKRTRIFAYLIALLLTVGLFGGLWKAAYAWRHRRVPAEEKKDGPPPWDPEQDPRPFGQDDPSLYPWLKYPMVNGLFNGIRTLVPYSHWRPEPEQEQMFEVSSSPVDGPVPPTTRLIPLPLQRHNPYPDYDSKTYLAEYHPVEPCFLDENNTRPAPDIYKYPGVPQQLTAPLFGSYEELGLPHDVCFDRYGRFGPYGYGYEESEGGLGIGMFTEREGSEALWERQGRIDYRGIDWGDAQKRCYEKNVDRFREHQQSSSNIARLWSGSDKKRVARSAYVLRAWTGFKYTQHEIMYLRAMINELSLKSGGEYDVHLLLHVRDDSIPIWTDKEVYQKAIEEHIPEEFWGITTLWSEQLMRLYYPGPLDQVFENPSHGDPHGVYRAQHLGLQWFGHQHPEYDYVWNWEMDIRYSGNLYEFHEGVAKWAKKQPRKGLWERNAKFWIPSKHGNYSEFTRLVDEEIMESGQVPVWGPTSFPNRGRVETPENTTPPRGYLEDNFEWGVGEEADLITFNPIFDPAQTNWVFRDDITGYSLDLPIPPRRCAIVTVSRLSRRLLDLMHEETYRLKHTAFPEMWPPTVALHHGLKAVYIPHPVYFDRQWPIDVLDQKYNHPKTKMHSVFGYGEHNQLGNSFYFNSYFSGQIWRRWLGEIEDKKGGAAYEKENTGRMCLRPVLHHPIKSEDSPVLVPA